MTRTRNNLAALTVLLAASSPAWAIDIVFDYSLDTNNFFLDPARQAVLDEAAAVFEVFTDSLAAIDPDPQGGLGNTWEPIFTHPSSGQTNYTIADMPVPADTIQIFVGARDLTGNTIGAGGPGGFDAEGFQPFVDAVIGRGQPGALAPIPTDFGTWGGAISFDIFTNWHFDRQTAPAGNELDFFSTAVHELAHVLGFGTAVSFDVQVGVTEFLGSAAIAAFGSPPPLDNDQQHWQIGTTSAVPGGGPQETAMDPDILDGEVKLFTLLDYAAMADIGWEVPPLTGAGLDGDLDGDGFVGISDLNIVLGAWNQAVAPGDPLLGDPSGDGFVGIEDLNTVLGNWNAGAPPTATVPEPAGLTLLLASAAACLPRRPRESR
jgi:hypothetical protein